MRIMNQIPNARDIKIFLELRKFQNTFLRNLERTVNENKNSTVVDFTDYVFKEIIIENMIERGYGVQYMKYKQMYNISWA